MRKIIIALLTVTMAFGMLVSTASAAVVGTLDHNVFPTRVTMTAEGVGSFNITVPGSGTPYAGVQFVVQLPDGVTISAVNYSLTDVRTNPPQMSPDDMVKDTFYFSCYAEENKFTAALTCTVNVTYRGVTEKPSPSKRSSDPG